MFESLSLMGSTFTGSNKEKGPPAKDPKARADSTIPPSLSSGEAESTLDATISPRDTRVSATPVDMSTQPAVFCLLHQKKVTKGNEK